MSRHAIVCLRCMIRQEIAEASRAERMKWALTRPEAERETPAPDPDPRAIFLTPEAAQAHAAECGGAMGYLLHAGDPLLQAVVDQEAAE